MDYTVITEPGQWQPTPPGLCRALLPQWPDVTPFALTHGSQFRPAGPPELDSDAEYANDLNEVRVAWGGRQHRAGPPTRPRSPTSGPTAPVRPRRRATGTRSPQGGRDRGTSLVENARLFALLDIALADAGIAAWDAKYATTSGGRSRRSTRPTSTTTR